MSSEIPTEESKFIVNEHFDAVLSQTATLLKLQRFNLHDEDQAMQLSVLCTLVMRMYEQKMRVTPGNLLSMMEKTHDVLLAWREKIEECIENGEATQLLQDVDAQLYDMQEEDIPEGNEEHDE